VLWPCTCLEKLLEEVFALPPTAQHFLLTQTSTRVLGVPPHHPLSTQRINQTIHTH
jgi:hypothetical protein